MYVSFGNDYVVYWFNNGFIDIFLIIEFVRDVVIQLMKDLIIFYNLGFWIFVISKLVLVGCLLYFVVVKNYFVCDEVYNVMVILCNLNLMWLVVVFFSVKIIFFDN